MSKARDSRTNDAPLDEDSMELAEAAQALDATWALLESVQLDAKQRAFVWPDARRLSFEQSVQHIHECHRELAVARIERAVISFIENYAPQGASDDELDELDRLADEWVDELEMHAR